MRALFYGEIREMPRREARFDVDAAYRGARRAFLEPLPERGQGRGLALGHELDAPVRKIAHPAQEAQALRLAARIIAETHSLDASRNRGTEGGAPPLMPARQGAPPSRRRSAAPVPGSRRACR